MKKMDLNRITEISEWSERTLGLKPFAIVERNVSKIDKEYDKEKYSKLYTSYKKDKTASYDLRKYELFGEIKNATMYISKGDDLYQSNFDEVERMWERILYDEIKKEIKGVDAIVELGCGWGYNLSLLRRRMKNITLVGGDYSHNGVDLGNMIFKDRNIKLEKFDFYDSDWTIFDNYKNVIVFTSHSIEQIPNCTEVIKTMKKYSSKIKCIINFEPVTEIYTNSLMDCMRKKYAQLNDYNRNLMDNVIDENLIEVKKKVLGVNPFNPTTIVKWKCKL
jgi:hypothetical protein